MCESTIGARVVRLDVAEKATGAAQFGFDVALPGMLCGRLYRSELPHARLLDVDVSKARRVAGVKAVVTAREAPAGRMGLFLKDQPLLAADRVRFIGEPLAAVAAVDEDAAQEALDRIEVDYDELPPVFDPVEAMTPGAPVLHEALADYRTTYQAVRYGNVCSETRFRHGDVERALQSADLVVEETFSTQAVHQAPMEPRVAVASVDPTGKLTVWTSSQAPFEVAETLHELLDLPLSKIRIVVPRVGGSFGAKHLLVEPYAAVLASRAGRPVRVTFGRTEEFIGGNPRHPSQTTLTLAVLRDGTMLGLRARAIFDTGAYAQHGPAIASFGGMVLGTMYRLPSYDIASYCVYTNKLPFGAFRGYGNPQVTFARESIVDVAARRLGLDPLEMRLRNLAEDGDLTTTGQRLRAVSSRQCLVEAARAAGWTEQNHRSQDGRGLGIACMMHTTGFLSSAATVTVHEDGTVTVACGAVEVGAGQETILAQFAADELDVSLDRVSVVMGDTQSCPYDFGAGASRVTYSAGHAVKLAAVDARNQIFQVAAEELEADPADLELRAGQIRVKGSPDRSLALGRIARMAYFKRGGPILGAGRHLPRVETLEPREATGAVTTFWPAFCFAAQAAEVQVDRETGQVKVLRFVGAHDVGRAINLTAVEGQIEGGLAQGLGYALGEAMSFDGGRVVNPSFADYKLPGAPDLPEMVPIVVEVPDQTGPNGAKGIGECGPVATAPAIANAIADAVGVRITALPMRPEKVLEALNG